jgi:hypothetical protein
VEAILLLAVVTIYGLAIGSIVLSLVLILRSRTRGIGTFALGTGLLGAALLILLSALAQDSNPSNQANVPSLIAQAGLAGCGIGSLTALLIATFVIMMTRFLDFLKRIFR